MTEQELRDGINRILFHTLSNEERADKITELLAPELEKAEKWDKVQEIASVCPIRECPVYYKCDKECLMGQIVEDLKEPT